MHLSLWEGESQVHSSAPGSTRVPLSAGGNDNVLPSANFICNRRSIRREGQLCFPQQFPRSLVVGAEFFVENGCSDKEHSAGRNDGTTVIFRAGVGKALGNQVRILSKSLFPHIFAGIQTDGVQCPPRRCCG